MCIIQTCVNMSESQVLFSEILQDVLIHESSPSLPSMLWSHAIVVYVTVVLVWEEHESHKANDVALFLQNPDPFRVVSEQTAYLSCLPLFPRQLRVMPDCLVAFSAEHLHVAPMNRRIAGNGNLIDSRHVVTSCMPQGYSIFSGNSQFQNPQKEKTAKFIRMFGG